MPFHLFSRLACCAILSVAPVLAVTVPANSSQIPDSLLPLLVKKERIGRALSEPIVDCIGRRDTNHPVFHGCIDWHSSVHGHWALMALSRGISNFSLSGSVREAFVGDGIAREMEHLARRSTFEMPYGWAWFLRLAIEHIRVKKSDSIRKYADPILRSLMSYFGNKGVDLYSTNYSSATWALTNMLDYASQVDLETERKEILTRVRKELDHWEFDCSYERERGRFMAICTNIALLASRALSAEEFRRWASLYQTRIGLPKAVSEPISPHHHGLNFSRAWGLWELYAATGLLEFADAYSAHFLETMNEPSQWKGNYQRVGHWVAQFGVFALQPLFGRGNGR